MLNNKWDENLRDLLGDYKPEGLQPNWDEFMNQMDQIAELNGTGDDPDFDTNLKESFKEFQASGQDIGWDRIKASLDATNRQFDEDIRRRIAQFEPKYDPRTWPLFLQRFADSNFLGVKLIALKVVEVAAVLLILFTFVNMGRMGKLPFDTPLYNKPSDELNSEKSHNGMADNSFQQNDINTSAIKANTISKKDKTGISNPDQIEAKTFSGSLQNVNGTATSTSTFSASLISGTSNDEIWGKSKSGTATFIDPIKSYTGISSANPNEHTVPSVLPTGTLIQFQNLDGTYTTTTDNLIASAEQDTRGANIDFIFSFISPVSYGNGFILPNPTFIKQRHKTQVEFGILTEMDYNRLKMPEDKLIASGKQITFPQQGLPSYSYGGGFTLALAHHRWALESGLIYNSKTFKPGRKLAVGTAFDNGVIEFKAMRMQLVTMPVQMRYKIDNKGPFRFYAIAGFDLNLIVQSDVDVSIQYHFPSLSAGENPNNNPGIAQTIKETRRISEHIRDGAPFNTKSFVSATGGLGFEYSFNEHKTLFIQSAVQYQIPNLQFSNNNGKHIRSISIQAGVRTPLGK